MRVSTCIGGGLQSNRVKRTSRGGEARVIRQRQLQLLSVTACAIAGLMSKSAVAASGNWTGATDATWAGNNWSATPVPGIGDTATFNGLGSGHTTIDLGGGITIQNILFDTTNAAAYNIGAGAVGAQSLTLNTSGGITMTSTVANNELFDAGLILGINASSAAYTITNNSTTNSLSFAGNVMGGPVGGTAGTKTLNVAGTGNTVFSGSLLLGNASNIALTKYGTGSLTFNGTANAALLGNGATGGAYGPVTVNSGSLVLDFSNYNAVNNANLLNSYTPVTLAGGTLQMIGNATNASAQSFNNGSGLTVNPGVNVVAVGPNAGNVTNPLPTLNLGAFTQTVGSQTVFNGPAYYNSASGATAVTVPATGTITTTTLGNQNNLLWSTSRVAIATVGLYNWASVVDSPAGTQSILSGDQVANFYSQIAAGGTATAADSNFDLLGNATANNTTLWYCDTLRFNVPGAFTFTTNTPGTGHIALVGGILVTPNVGANNTTIANGGAYMAGAYTSAGNCAIDVYQNDTAGELFINVPFYYYSANTRKTSYVKGGAGTVDLTGSGGNSANTGAPFLNGGCTVINNDNQIGAAATAATLSLNGGTLVSSASMTLGNGATANPRPITLLGNGGGLAAVAGTTLTVDGQIGSAAGVGTLVIGIPASSANGNVAGLLPGTGANTANTTPVYGTGTVALTYANGTNGNVQYSPTLITAGATLQINSQYDLGGANAGSLTFNNGTLQYSATLATGAAGTATDISAQAVIFSGPATIDTNGHSISYANSIGGGGSGSLTVMSTGTGGSLTLSAANSYTGGTTLSSGTLNVTNTAGSATGTGLVTVAGGTLTGNGIITGTVNASGGAIAPGPTGNLTVGTFNYTSGNLNFSINGTAGTASQISAGAVSFFAAPTFGTFSLSGATSIHPGATYTVLTSSTAISGGSFLSSLTPQTIGRFTFSPSEVNGNSIVLAVTGNPANLTWAGGTSLTASTGDGSTWSNTQTATVAGNWNNSGAADYFYDLDNVKFLDPGSPSHTVSLTTTVSPSSVTVTTGSTYTFLGSGSIAGAGNLLVTSGTLDLNTASNTYSGGTNISAGASVVTGAAAALPATGTVIVAGTLDLNGYSQTIGALSDGGVSTGVINSSSGSATLTVPVAGTNTFRGLILNGTGGTLGLAFSGTGTAILTNSNTYTGPTTIGLGTTLQIGNNTPLLALPSGSAVTDNGSLVFNLSTGTTIPISNTITGTGSVTLNGPTANMLQMGGNSYSGGTTINAGAIQLTDANGIGTGDLTIASGANLDLNGNGPTIGALNGAGSIDSSSGSTMTLTIGNNNDSGTFSGPIKNTNGTLSLTKAGTGTQTLSGTSSYTGITAVNAGTLNITGSVGSAASPSAVLNDTGGNLTINGGTVYGSTLYESNNGTVTTVTGNGTLVLSGQLCADAANSAVSGSIQLLSGTVSANSVSIGRDQLATTGFPVPGTGDGLYINGASLTVATTLAVGQAPNGTFANSNSIMRMDSGSVTVNGTTTLNSGGTNRGVVLQINGGTFTSNDTTGAGIQIGADADTAGVVLSAELLISNGTVNTKTITLGNAAQTAGTDELIVTGGTTYIGSGGIALGGAANTTITVDLGSTASANAPLIGASANWSSGAAMVLGNSNTGVPVTFKAASSSGTTNNITLTAALSGTGGLTKTGTGYLALTGGTSYTGATNVSAGALVDAANTVLSKTFALNINGSLIIQNSPSLQNITQEVAGGYNGGAWNGSSSSAGIPITSSAAASDATHLRALGVIQNDNGSGIQLYSTFEGYSSLNDSDALVKLTYYGDTDLNGEVDGSDYSRIDNAFLFNQTASSPLTGWFNGDFNYDGVINGSDYTLMDNAFNTQGALIASEIASPNAVATAQIAGAGTSAVPEPTTLGLLGMGAASLLGRRRRYR